MEIDTSKMHALGIENGQTILASRPDTNRKMPAQVVTSIQRGVRLSPQLLKYLELSGTTVGITRKERNVLVFRVISPSDSAKAVAAPTSMDYGRYPFQ